MSRLVKQGAVVCIAAAILAAPLLSFTGFAATDSTRMGIGDVASEEEISRWDIDIRPDGLGLPEGHGTVSQGEMIYAEKCAHCHGDFGEGLGNFPVLVGGAPKELESGERPEKTIGSFWPYASTLFDYIRRAMPFGEAQSLTANETYALTAFLLAMNDVIPEDSVLNAESLAAIRMPNADGFYFDPAPDIANMSCMSNCSGVPAEIVSFARILDVTPDGLEAEIKGE